MPWLTRDIPKLLSLYAICIVCTYFLTDVLNQLFFLYLLYLFYKSKENYFWLAFIFFLADPPASLFPLNDYNYGLPMYNFLPGSGRLVYFQELFTITALFKIWRLNLKTPLVFLKPLTVLAAYFLILLTISFFLGVAPLKIFLTLRKVFSWGLLFAIIAFMKKQEDWINFFKIIFVLLIISVISQIFFIILGYPPAYALGTDFAPMMDYGQEAVSISEYSKEDLRPISSPYLALIALMGAMFYSLYNRPIFNKNYLFFIIALSFFSILVTATRGWIVSYSFMIGLFMIIGGGKFKRYIQLPVVFILAGILVFNSPFAVIKNQVDNALMRFGTVGKIAEGDLSAGGTLARLDEYSPKVMAKFYESPVYGWAFSDDYFSYTNSHVGNQSLLLNVGVIGFLLFLYFWISVCYKPIKIKQLIKFDNPYKLALIVIPVVFSGLFIIHSSSGQLFEYLINYYQVGMVQFILYAFANFCIIDSLALQNKSNALKNKAQPILSPGVKIES